MSNFDEDEVFITSEIHPSGFLDSTVLRRHSVFRDIKLSASIFREISKSSDNPNSEDNKLKFKKATEGCVEYFIDLFQNGSA